MRLSDRITRALIDVVALAVCAAGSALALLDVRTPARPYVVLIALVLGIGWATTGWLRVSEPAYAGTLVLAAGVSIPILVGVFFVEIHWWHPVAVAGVLLAAAAAGNVAALARDLARMGSS